MAYERIVYYMIDGAIELGPYSNSDYLREISGVRTPFSDSKWMHKLCFDGDTFGVWCRLKNEKGAIQFHAYWLRMTKNRDITKFIKSVHVGNPISFFDQIKKDIPVMKTLLTLMGVDFSGEPDEEI